MDGLDNRDDRDRWMAWGGPAFLLLFIATGLLLGGEIKDDLAGTKVIDEVLDQKDGAIVAAFLAAPSAAFLLFFAARLRSLLGDSAGAARHLLQYGAVLFASAIVFGAVIMLGMISAADNKQAETAQALNVLNSVSWIPMVAGIAVFLIGAGLSVLRTGVLPTWMGWIALVVGVVSMIGPGGFAGYFVAPLWVGVAGIMLAIRKDAPGAVTV
jgi:hypothetical protein